MKATIETPKYTFTRYGIDSMDNIHLWSDNFLMVIHKYGTTVIPVKEITYIEIEDE